MVVNIKQGTIFVSIASYRDPVCTNTVTEIYRTAEFPEKVFVGLCQQNNKEDKECVPDNFKYKNNIRTIRIPSIEAKGPTLARYLCSTLHDGEEYYMQIDSHSKFTKHWDTKCMNMIKEIKEMKLSDKPVISSYPSGIESYKEDDDSTIVTTMCRSYFTDRGMLSLHGAEYIDNPKYYETPYLASGFFFCESKFLEELPYDPKLDYVFIGEEIHHAIRFYTHGYNIYTPSKNIIYHEYTRADKPKIWTDKQYNDDEAFEKIKIMIGLGGNSKLLSEEMKASMKVYGMGNVRSIEDYYKFAGVDIKNKIVYKDFCKKNQLNPDYENCVIDGSGTITCINNKKESNNIYFIGVTTTIIITIAIIFIIYFQILKTQSL